MFELTVNFLEKEFNWIQVSLDIRMSLSLEKRC